jgi:release factor glutamine methyltransferase
VRARDAALRARERLAAAGLDDAAFEAEYLVRDAAGLTRAAFFEGATLPAAAMASVEAAIARREQREPAPYITGRREFRGLDLAVGPGVLVPRPETELLVDLAVHEAMESAGPLVVDVGTGTGCVAVAVAIELEGWGRVVAIDVSEAALGYARLNARRHGAPVRFVLGDLATPLRVADIIVANLPYIASEDIDALEPEVSRWEPRVALDGGPDGLRLIRRLVADCGQRLRPRLLALEVGYGMAETTAAIARGHGATTSVVRDFAGIDRVVCCRWR